MTDATGRAGASERQITIVYVAGIGRTGTTVLGEMLDRIPDVRFVGELSRFWRRYTGREVCSCGSPLPDCPFWSEVVRKAFGDLTMAGAEEFAELEQRLLRRQAWQLLASPHWGAEGDARRMVEERQRLYGAVSEVAESRWIVDTGKEPVFGASLPRIGGADVVIVQLVRDPRGVVYSSNKRVTSDSEQGEMTHWPTAVTAAVWVANNLVAQFPLRRLARRYLRLRYEDLIGDPASSLSRVAAAAGLVVGDPRAVLARLAEPPQDQHLVAGNPGVRRLGGVLRLSLDEEWRAGLPARDRRLVTAICAAPMAMYGYSVRGRRAQPSPPTERSRVDGGG